jgi:hypothetical protein
VAEVFLYKDGTTSDHRASRPRRVSMDKLLDKTTAFETRFTTNPPDFNRAHGPAGADEPFLHVVARVEETELNGSFPEAGYYHIVGMTPDDAREAFGL